MKITWMDMANTDLVYFMLFVNCFLIIILIQMLNNYQEKIILLVYLIGDFIMEINYHIIDKNYLIYTIIIYIFLSVYISIKKKSYILLLMPFLTIFLKIIYLFIYLFIYYNEINSILIKISR
jgi:hypothetical protein